jgi:hypothetical protein
VDRRGDDPGHEDGVGELEEHISAALETLVLKGIPKGA